MGRLLFLPYLIKQIKSIKYLLKDKNAKKRYKAAVIFGILYLVTPIDLIPAPILGLSIVDDIVIWGFILNYIKVPLEQYSDQYHADKASKEAMKGKKIIDDVEYTVKDDDEETQEK